MSVGFILVRYMPAYLLFVSTPASLSDKEVVPLPVCFLVIAGYFNVIHGS